MAWTFYELRFRLLSPLHIGHQKIGNIQRTRHYVPARTLWGALTARLTREARVRALTDVAEEDYVGMGALVKEQIVFTYFFPAIEAEPPVLPCYGDGGLSYLAGSARLSPDMFASQHLGSYAATALNYERNSAEDASLHEVEFITPHGRLQNTSRPVDLCGYIVVAESCKLPWPELRAALQELRIGGERRYGWGLLRLERAEKCGAGEAILFGKLSCHAKDGARRPTVFADDNAVLAAHTVVDGITASGEIEPLVGRVWEQTKGAGQAVEFTGVCYAPGARLKSSHTFEMTESHVWRAATD